MKIDSVTSRGFLRTSLLLAGTLLAAAPVFGQSAPHLSPHTFEVGGFVGSSFGLDKYRVMGGGNVSYGINKWILPYAEYSYFPGIERNLRDKFPTTGQAYTLKYNIPITDVHGGVHIRLPIRESRIVPYLVAGAGVLRTTDRTVLAFYEVPGGTSFEQEISPSGSSDFAVNFGGGLRYYTNQRFGMRLEAKAYRPTGEFTNIFGKVEFGFFFQFR
ncbi:MAG: hypothetical protein H7Y20_07510 [Bryobacteraceae bacterium]|nr:hypothetical protein [Bryobacteraceae bacterium]